MVVHEIDYVLYCVLFILHLQFISLLPLPSHTLIGGKLIYLYVNRKFVCYINKLGSVKHSTRK